MKNQKYKEKTEEKPSPVINVNPVTKTVADCFSKFLADLSANINPKKMN
jgi:hypothetical protein